MSTKSISSINSNSSSKASVVKPTAPPVSRAQTNLSRSAASSTQSLHSSTSGTQSTVKTAHSLRRSTSSNEILTENIDDFSLGDRVWVNGQRAGHIRYLGDTQFAPGKWAGIELEAEEGKNDGSVAGVRYFECKPKFGVFVRPQRLTRKQIEEQKSSNKSSPSRETVSPLTPTSAVTEKLNSSLGSNKTNGNGNTSGSTNGSHYSLSRYEQKFSVGDRVLVNATSGTKLGTLQYLGAADFAPGRWAGIELDEPMGKNDGSVAGKRYFKCEMKYGLFAPIHKISAAPLSALKVQKKSNSAAAGPKRVGALNRQRSGGSQESLNSIASSTASSTRPSRVRLGVTSLSSAQKGTKNTLASQVTATQTALNDCIKEKEDHITQLLKERDLERGEVARAAAQADSLEEKLTALQTEHQKLVVEADEEIQELKRLNQEYEEMQIKLNTQLEDERKKLEDLQFRLEEETIMRSELESQTTALKEEIEKLKKDIKSSAELRTKSESEQVDTLEEKLRELENKRENDMFALQEDLVRKEEAVLQLEASVEKRDIELANCQKRLLELESELESTKQRTGRQIESIDELNLKIKSEESLKQQLLDENKALKQQLTDCEKRLLNLEEKLSEISSGKSHLEQELDSKESAERQLEERLLETKSKYEKFEAEVHSLAAELSHIKSVCDQEVKRRQEAEDRVEELSALNRNLELKVEDLMRTSGSNSDLLLKINTEVMEKQKEFQQKEKQLKQEIDSIRKERDSKSDDIRVLSIELEDKKSLVSRFEKKQSEFDKNIQILENELKLTRSDCDEKQALVSDLRREVNDMKLKLNTVSKDQELSKGQLEYKLKDTEKELHLREQELETSRKEFRELRDKKFELELERDRLKRESDKLEKTCEDRQHVIEGLRQDLKQMREEFEKYRTNLEKQLEATKVTNLELKEIGTDLDRQKQVYKEVEEENQSLKDDNRHLREKVEELRDDIEALDKRHREVLTEFEYECERLQQRAVTGEQLAEDKQRQLLELEEQQTITFETFKRQAQIEKRQLEQTLNDLEVKVRESITANTRRYERETEGTDNYEQQIEFLNSVIVDMQKKNDELRNRVQVLEEIGLDQFESSFNSRAQVTNGHIRAPRMFCDICDIFDAHETEDCPRQANLDQDTSGHTYYHAIRTERRSYCDHCERFGHNNNECPDTETY